MTIEHLIYTSCKRGIKNINSAYQVYSQTPGISDEISEEISNKLHETVNSLNINIESNKNIDFVFDYFKLSDGNLCISSTFCSNTNQINENNYVSRAIILNNKLNFYPIELYDSPIFKINFTQEDFNKDETPNYLLPFNDFEYSENFNLSSVISFIYSKIDSLKKILYCLIDYETSSKKILINDNVSNIPNWLAAIQMSFPVKFAANIEFTSFCNQVTSTSPVICCSSCESEELLTNIINNTDLHVFDFINNNIPDIVIDSKFINFIEQCFLNSYEAIWEFHRFLNGFSYSNISTEINYAYNLFDLTNNVDNITNKDLISSLNFAEKYCSPSVLNSLFLKIHENKNILIGLYNIEITEKIATFLISSSYKLSSQDFQNKAYLFIYEHLHNLLLDMTINKLDELLSFYEKLKKFDSTYSNKFESFLFSDLMLSNLLDWLKDDNNIYHNSFYLIILFNHIENYNLDFNEFILNTPNKLLLSQIYLNLDLMPSNSSIDILNLSIDLLSNNYSNLSKLLIFVENEIFFVNQSFKDSFWDYFTEVSKSKDEEWINSVFSVLSDSKLYSKCFNTFMSVFKESNNKKSYFWSFYNNFVIRYPEFESQLLKPAIDFFISQSKLLFNSELIIESYIDVLKELFQRNIEKEYIFEIINNFEMIIPMTKPSMVIVDFIPLLLEYKRQNQIYINPDKSYLLYLGITAEYKFSNSDFSFIEEDLSKSNIDLSRFSKLQLVEFFMWFLPLVITSIKTKESHDTFISVFKSHYNGNFYELYATELASISKREKDKSNELIVSFIKHVVANKECNNIDVITYEELITCIEDIFVSMYDGRINSIKNYITSNNIFTNSETDFFDSILLNVNKRKQNSILGKIKSLFKKKE